MKTALTILAVLVGISAVAFIAARSWQNPPTTEIAVLRDVTDKELAQPDLAEILGMYDFSSGSMWNGGIFSFANVTDVSYNKTEQVKIETANQWLSNELDRDKAVKEFQNGVSKIITDAANDNMGRTHSSIYIPIANELNVLSQSKSQKRILIIYSDLMENDLDLSLYRNKEFQLLTSNPNSLKTLFEKWQPLPSLTGIEVILIYQPADAASDEQYSIVSAFYKDLLEEKGAEVTIKANI